MAYLRMGGPEKSSVYVYASMDDELLCLNCRLEFEAGSGRHKYVAVSTQDMINHLEAHRAAGHTVPYWDDVVAELWEDDAENFPP